MEKFSKFIDPMTGINPFVPPKQQKITIKMFFRFMCYLPLYLLYKLGVVAINSFITIKVKNKMTLYKRIFANKVCEFDKEIIYMALDIKGYVEFPEQCSTNNRGILKYSDTKCDYVIGLKYTDECIYMHGSRIKWLIRFLGSDNKVTVCCDRGNNLEKVTGLKTVNFTHIDKARFLKQF